MMFLHDQSINPLQCLIMMEYWNYIKCGEYEPMGLTIENRYNITLFEQTLGLKKELWR